MPSRRAAAPLRSARRPAPCRRRSRGGSKSTDRDGGGMIGRGLRRRTGAVLGGTALVALLGGSLVAPAEAAPTAPPGECQQTMTAAQATTGLVGQGLTVVKGTTPEPFRVEVIGVLEDGIGAGRDLVLVKVSDLPGGHVIEQGGGMWAGISGSPVYVGGKLLGALSY